MECLKREINLHNVLIGNHLITNKTKNMKKIVFTTLIALVTLVVVSKQEAPELSRPIASVGKAAFTNQVVLNTEWFTTESARDADKNGAVLGLMMGGNVIISTSNRTSSACADCWTTYGWKIVYCYQPQ
jgi:hypothetical protein